jgi:hypothetical protein
MRAIGFAAIASGLIVAAPISAAADQTITETFSLTIPPTVVQTATANSEQVFTSTPFPLFAPTFGMLDAVSAMISGPLTAASIAENPSLTFILFTPAPANSGVVRIDGEDYNIVPPGTIDLNLSGSRNKDDGADQFLGTGTGEVTLFVNTQDPSNTTVLKSDGPLTGSVTYTYALPTGALPVPEPATWTMMLVSFAGLGFLGYRQTRKGQAGPQTSAKRRAARRAPA